MPVSSAFAESIIGALQKAYSNNSQLNSDRAGVRIQDEGVAIAKSGYRPVVNAVGSIDYSSTGLSTGGSTGTRLSTGTFGITISQTLFDGFQTRNSVNAADARVLAARENLRNSGQNVFFDAASAYMDVIRDRQIAVLRQRNLEFLQEQVRAARSRFDVGEGTRTDVAQAEARRSGALAQLSAAKAAASASEATYRQIIGEDPGKLSPAQPLDRLLPASLDSVLVRAETNHPAIQANKYLADAAAYVVKANEGAFLPQVSADASYGNNYRHSITGGTHSYQTYDSGSIGLTVRVPIYQGGRASASVRQSKEQLGQAQINIDVVRDLIRRNATAAWHQYMAAKTAMVANRDLVNAARLALNGVIEERNVGQRTTLDVLNAQNDVITAQLTLLQAERDLVVASYAILSSTGDLSVRKLNLRVAEYKPEEHYEAVKDKWYGLRTPDGR
ncbi:transporter [Zhengella mangrovi]|uniref:Transporter n=1 Tax=Zhengella mangrovi TaxID=1982044 RepID=A0A2G1QR83_9HYPH|nr:TolC family outer membrane protein [Zhengella mangrovi]PHP67991.1 transporter [Zhengella mangrovi]